MHLLQVKGVSKQEDGRYLLNKISFIQEAYRKVSVAGATGSGKTTLLKIIAGLVQPAEGEVLFEGERVRGPEERLLPGHPHIAYLSQHFELRNHYRVEELLEMAARVGEEEAARIYRLCRVDHLLKRWSHQLSGGERQRISLARLLVGAPKLLLLDEPYSNLDAFHREILKTVLNDLADTVKITCILVSHDPMDMLSWADEVMVLQAGEVMQQGSPQEVYRTPVSEYAAALFGKYTILGPALAIALSAITDIEMSRIGSFIRPECFKIVDKQREGVMAEVRRSSFMGGYYEVELSVAGDPLVLYHDKELKRGEGVKVVMEL